MEFADETPVPLQEVVRARRATSADLGRLYERRAEAFAGVAASICGEAAADAVHDAFVRALARAGSLRSRGALEDWVWRIVLNEARRHRIGIGTSEAGRPQTTRAHSSGEVDPRGSVVRAAVAALPPRQREVAFLRYFADLDEASIASALGIRRGTVAATLHRVHARVLAAIDEEDKNS